MSTASLVSSKLSSKTPIKSSLKKGKSKFSKKKGVKFEDESHISEKGENQQAIEVAPAKSLKKNFSLPEIRTSMKTDEDDAPIMSMKGYPTSRQKNLQDSTPALVPNAGRKRRSVVGSIKDRIQNAIKKSQNNRYNRDAIDDLGHMDFNIDKSNVEEKTLIKPIYEEKEEDLERAERNLPIHQDEDVHALNGDYRIKLNDVEQKKPRLIIGGNKGTSLKNVSLKDEKPKKPFSTTRWSYPEFDGESKILLGKKKDEIPNEQVKLSTLESPLPKERKRLPSLEIQPSLEVQPSQSTLNGKTVSFAEALQGDKMQATLPSKIIPMDQKLEVPDFDTTKRLKKKHSELTKKGLSEKLYKDVDEFKDLREEQEKRNRISAEKGEQLRLNFVQTAMIHKPNIVSEFMKAFSLETKNIHELIETENKKKEDMYQKPFGANSKKVKQFTDTLVSQSSLMQKLLNKKTNKKKKNSLRSQLAKKFDKLFNYNEKRPPIKPLKSKKGPKLYLHKQHVILAKNETMLYKYDVRDKKYTMHDTAAKTASKYSFPSFCDLLNGTIFVTGGIPEEEGADPVGNSYMVEGYQAKVTHADSMITPRYKHELVFCNKCVYSLGGYTKKRAITKNVEKYDFQNGEWERVPQMFHERADFTAIASQSSKSLYVFGGCINEQDNLLIEKFDCRCEVWVTLKIRMKFNINKYHHLCIVREGTAADDSSEVDQEEHKNSNVKDQKESDPEPLKPISAVNNPNEAEVLEHPPELLHEKIEKRSLLLKQGKDVKEGPSDNSKGVKRKIEVDRSLHGNPSKTKISTLSDPARPSSEENDGRDEIFDIHRKILEEVSKIKFNDCITIIEYIPKEKQVNLHFLNLKEQKYRIVQLETQESGPMKGAVYRAFFNENKLYLFRKQPIDQAQVINMQEADNYGTGNKKLQTENLIFEKVEQEDILQEEERDKPDYDPRVRQKELGFLDRVEQDRVNSSNSVGMKEDTKELEIKKKPKLENSDDERLKPRKINFSLKNPNKESESKILKNIKAKTFKFTVKPHKSTAIAEKLTALAEEKKKSSTIPKSSIKPLKKETSKEKEDLNKENTPEIPEQDSEEAPSQTKQKKSGKKKVRFE
ncbi:unnamed protein product [Moneuplotes crassus]|uniref:Kelch motif family protein n=1 Tax=Euplotes crassus TaxID=5936 RepID=A0AAD1UTI5_EUPCR|nr:unnamed protein product [Moneuplotes crassus]